MSEEDTLTAELDELRRTAPKRKHEESGVWPFRHKEPLTPEERRRLEAEALLTHCQTQQARLQQLAGPHWLDMSSGPSYDRTYDKGLSQVLSEAKRQFPTTLQALAAAVAYGRRKGWLTTEDAATLDLQPPRVAEVDEALAAEREERAEWDRAFQQILDEAKDKARAAGKAPGEAAQRALTLWNRDGNLRKYDAESLQRWRLLVRQSDRKEE